MQFFNVDLPTKKYLKKYLYSCYGAPLVASYDTDLGDRLLSKLSSKLPCKLPDSDRRILIRRLTASVQIKVPIDYIRRINASPSDDTVILINRFFEQKFKEEMFHVVERASWLQISKKYSIQSFANNHGIEIGEEETDDITYEALKQMEHRFREDAKKKNRFRGMLNIAAMLF
ncbi:MAG: hypothetical protein EOP84_02050 [Verrucomicrobiaceae bacterium]|nr:MAG: hypothetical protein EOP84_02050 [Verrucomicrobiaceae bacterium]